MSEWPSQTSELRERADELEAEERYEEALDLRRHIMRSLVVPGPLSSPAESDAACALVWGLTACRRYEECLVVGTRALGRLRPGDPSEPYLRFHQALSAGQLGFTDDAFVLYERCIAAAEPDASAAPLAHEARQALIELGGAATEDEDDEFAALSESLDRAEAVVLWDEDADAIREERAGLARTVLQHAHVDLDYREVIEAAEQDDEAPRLRLAQLRAAYSTHLAARGRDGEIDAVWEGDDRYRGVPTERLAEAYLTRGDELYGLRLPAEAAAAHEQAVAELLRTRDERDPRVARARIAVGKAWYAAGRLEQARAALEPALGVLAEREPDAPETTDGRHLLREVLRQLGDDPDSYEVTLDETALARAADDVSRSDLATQASGYGGHAELVTRLPTMTTAEVRALLEESYAHGDPAVVAGVYSELVRRVSEAAGWSRQARAPSSCGRLSCGRRPINPRSRACMRRSRHSSPNGWAMPTRWRRAERGRSSCCGAPRPR